MTSVRTLDLTPKAVAFSTQTLLTESSARTVTVTNGSGQAVMIDTLSISGPNANDFAFANNHCSGVNLNPQATCTFAVVFKPTAAGSRSAVVNIPSNAPNSPAMLPLSGFGSAPPPAADYGPSSASKPTGVHGEPVNTATGNYFYQHNDLVMPGLRLPFAFSRTYNAQDTSSGPLGLGWTHSYNIILTANGDALTPPAWRSPTMRRVTARGWSIRSAPARMATMR